MTDTERLEGLVVLLQSIQAGGNDFLVLPTLRAISEILQVPYDWDWKAKLDDNTRS